MSSDIQGKGYGDSHDWEYLKTTAGRVSIYRCRSCGEHFGHHYPRVPNIFEAMQEKGVSKDCSALCVGNER